jgi:hypothetical protein
MLQAVAAGAVEGAGALADELVLVSDEEASEPSDLAELVSDVSLLGALLLDEL